MAKPRLSYWTKLHHYLNPLRRLGTRRYSSRLPITVTVLACIVTEYLFLRVFIQGGQGSLIAIFLFIGLIVYFAFRDGLRGGFLAALITVNYYLYIVYTRQQDNFENGIRSTALFGISYFAIAGVIGWLRQTVDKVIEEEANGRRRLKAVIQQLPLGVIIRNARGEVEMANSQAEQILRTRIPIGHSIAKGPIVKGADTDKRARSPKQVFNEVMSNGKPVLRQEYELLPDKGAKVFVQSSTSVIRDGKGIPIALASIFSDITAEKEHELRKDDFINMASHELKTPITSIKLYTEMLMQRVKKINDETVQKAVERIGVQTEKLHELVVELLDVSRIQTGKLSLKLEEFRLDELAREIIEGVQKPTQSPIRLVCKNKVTVKADKLRIYQVLANLLSNAIKFSPEEKPITVRISTKGRKVLVEVKDRGLGIAKSKHAKIFERLYQVTDAPDTKYPGLGMGLYVAKEIIERHKGKIWVESQQGKGATFIISLPYQPGNQQRGIKRG